LNTAHQEPPGPQVLDFGQPQSAYAPQGGVVFGVAGKTPTTTNFPTLAGRRWFSVPRYTLTVLVLPLLSSPSKSETGGPTGATLSAEGDRLPSLASAAAVARAGPAAVVLLAVNGYLLPPARTPAAAFFRALRHQPVARVPRRHPQVTRSCPLVAA